MEAGAIMMKAKAKAARAQNAAASKEFERADQSLAEAADFLRDARETLGDDHAYDAKLDAIKSSLREATNAVRTHAEDIRKRIEQVLADAHRIVSTLESDQ